MIRRFAVLFSTFLAAHSAAGDPLLNLPIDCVLGQTCYIQNFVDRDPDEAEWHDFTCGRLSYDGHKGTDFALPSMAALHAGVNVIAAAPGTVRALRDEMPDIGLAGAGRDALKGRECGNGVVIDHGAGWVTQYCHMKLGSIVVKPGQRVTKSTVLGQVGLSGLTEFPHLHMSLRHKGEIVDPFAPDQAEACGAELGETLWQTPLPYRAGGLLRAGFSPGLPVYEEVKAGPVHPGPMAHNAPAMVLYGFGFGSLKGDVIRLQIDGPDGPMIRRDVTLKRNRAQFMQAAGRKHSGQNWPAGAYTGTVQLLRAGQVLSTVTTQTVVD